MSVVLAKPGPENFFKLFSGEMQESGPVFRLIWA
jgi:hypothetical protein